MATQKVTLTVDCADASGTLFTRGSVRIVPSFSRLGDTADEVLIEQVGVRAQFAADAATSGAPTVSLYPCDLVGPRNADGTPGWSYNVYYDRDCPGNLQPWSFQLLSSNGATAQRLSSQAASAPAQTAVQYVLLAGDVMQGALAPAVATVTDAAAVTPDAGLANLVLITLTADTVINAPANPKGDGQVIRLRIRQDATGGHVVTWGSGINFGTSPGVPQLDTAASAKNTVGLEWDAADGEWLGLGAGVY